MKRFILLVFLSAFYFISCTQSDGHTHEDGSEHTHSHEGDDHDHDHSHDDHTHDHEQEEFTAESDTLQVDSLKQTETDGQ